MQNFKLMSTLRLITFIVSAVLAVASTWPAAANAQEPDQNLASQLSELQAKVARLEAALNQKTSGGTAAAAMRSGKGNTQNKTAGATPSQRVSASYQNCIQCHQTRPLGPLPASHFESPGGNAKGTAEPGPADPSGTAAPQAPAPDNGMAKMGAGKGMGMEGKDKGKGGGMGMGGMDKSKMGGGMGMMEKMDGMMGMMEKMMGGMSGMGGGAMQPGKDAPAAGGMGMKDDGMDEMAPMPSPGAPASGGMSGMGGTSSAPANVRNGMMEKMDKMMGMMEKMMSAGAMQGAGGMSGMGGGASPATPESKVMEKMDKLMDMMQKMIGGGAMQPAPAAPAMAPMPMM
ncbi:MAG: hypothetical protein SFV81_06610 [Pirellulaceae bacterium]|nr:hypothetical protein [Pirellulaceae bacterium]